MTDLGHGKDLKFAKTIDPATPLEYSSTASISTDNQLSTKVYVDEHSTNGIWQRISTTISPKNSGDDVDIGTGTLTIGDIDISSHTIEDDTDDLNITASGTLKNINITATGSILNTINDGGSGYIYSIDGTSDNKLIYENNGKFTLTNVSDTDSSYGRYTYRGTASNLENGPNTVVHLGSDADPVFQHVNWDHDNINIGLDAYTIDGTNWVSSDTGSNCLLSKNSDEFKILYDSSVTKGTAITWNEGFKMDLTSGASTLVSATIGAINLSSHTIEDSTDDLNITASGASKDINLTSDTGDINIESTTGSIINTISTTGSGYLYQINAETDETGPNRFMFDQDGKCVLTNIESIGISDYAKFTIRDRDSHIDGPHMDVYTASDNANPIFQLLNWNSDDIGLGFAAYYTGTYWLSSDAGSNCRMVKNADELKILYDSGITAGNEITWNEGFRMDLTNGHIGLGGVAPSSSYQLLVNGDYNIGCQRVYGQTDISILGSDGTDYLFIDNSASTMELVAGGGLFAPTVYSSAVTGLDVYVSSAGRLGYDSSILKSKTNIYDFDNCDFIYDLNPKYFNKRKKLSEIKKLKNNSEEIEEDYYTDEFHPEIDYGLLAEDVEGINKDLVFYINGELAGVHYKKLIAPIIKCVQLQNERIKCLEAQLNK